MYVPAISKLPPRKNKKSCPFRCWRDEPSFHGLSSHQPGWRPKLYWKTFHIDLTQVDEVIPTAISTKRSLQHLTGKKIRLQNARRMWPPPPKPSYKLRMPTKLPDPALATPQPPLLGTTDMYLPGTPILEDLMAWDSSTSLDALVALTTHAHSHDYL